MKPIKPYLFARMALTKILKFGGSSVGTAERVREVMAIIREAAKSTKIAVVVSAFQGVTDDLIALSDLARNGNPEWESQFKEIHDRHLEAVRALLPPKRQTSSMSAVKSALNELENVVRGVSLVRECSLRTLDLIMSFGERLSALILADALDAAGTKAFFADTRELVRTDDAHGRARVDFEQTNKNIRAYFKKNSGLAVITGFIASSDEGATTTLGRSGSDYTAAIFGAALNVNTIEIWTDVDGVMSADPRRVKDAFVVEKMSYEEAMELSHFGAKVIHPHTMTPAIEKKIPIRIKNTFNPSAEGTLISDKPAKKHIVVGVSSIDRIALLNVEGSGLMGIPGIAERLFGALARHHISVVLIAQASSEYSICVAVSDQDKKEAVQALSSEFALEMEVGKVEPVKIVSDVSVIAVVGSNMAGRTGTAGTLFRALGDAGVNVVAIAQGLSELNISCIVNRDDVPVALNVIHQAFFLSKHKQIHLYLVGVGTIGSELLDQLAAQKETLKKELRFDLHLVGLGNSKKMTFDEDDIDFKKWKDALSKAKEKMDPAIFAERIKSLRKSHSVLIDCTASDAIPDIYEMLLKAHVSVVTPNKKFNARPLKEYRRLRQLTKKNGNGFFYETNVGAGLPIIETIKDLKNTGDCVTSIEGILSGTLSFIFNRYDGKKPFSGIVKEAQKKGYTEPDPREDLSGMDVARKLLILAREIGLALELKDIDVESLVPKTCEGDITLDEFYHRLVKEDAHFDTRLKAAKKEDCVLKYVGKIASGHASVKLEKVPTTHPFNALRGSDNIVALTTSRYNETPLIVQGPGAGPGVTAAGVFADILRAANKFS